jgi:hypothetical protein
VLIEATGSDHLPIQTSISVGNVVDSKPSSLFKMNVAHLESLDFCALVHRVWNLVPQPIGETRLVVVVGGCYSENCQVHERLGAYDCMQA